MNKWKQILRTEKSTGATWGVEWPTVMQPFVLVLDIPQRFSEKKTSPTSREAVQKKLFLLFSFTVLIWGQLVLPVPVLLHACSFWVQPPEGDPAWVSTFHLLSVFLSRSTHWWETTAVVSPDPWLGRGDAYTQEEMERRRSKGERGNQGKLYWPFIADTRSWNATHIKVSIQVL